MENHPDKRGKLVVFLKNQELKKKNKSFGQIYFITFKKKGIIRGNHYHKNWREWLAIVEGKAQVELENVKTKKHFSIVLDAESDKLIRLEIGPDIAHGFKSLSRTASLLNYAEKEWFPNDTFPYQLLK
jgi:dTDP-4-dehydrorhamnose 3,5-epimerase-like enzyme